jgi:hypothetical protein
MSHKYKIHRSQPKKYNALKGVGGKNFEQKGLLTQEQIIRLLIDFFDPS